VRAIDSHTANGVFASKDVRNSEQRGECSCIEP
jgi:hypothetical protein